jgi:hypothetical protein
MELWEKLEKKVKSLFKKDKVKTVPGSGNGKGEEDVIGISTIIQCKYTANKNITILDKDMQRLKTAAEGQNKLPIFVTENPSGMVISIPEGPLTQEIVNILIAMASLNKMEEDVDLCNSINIFNNMSKFISNDLEHLITCIEVSTKARINAINARLETKYKKLTQYDLFDELH